MRAVVLLLVAAALACSDLSGFDPELWKLTTTVRLKGSEVGGWQEACAYLKFVDTRESSLPPFQCGIKVGMPLATIKDGPISTEFAAQLTAAIATKAAGVTIHSQPAWLGEDYCIALRRKMKEFFPYSLGAIVNQC